MVVGPIKLGIRSEKLPFQIDTLQDQCQESQRSLYVLLFYLNTDTMLFPEVQQKDHQIGHWKTSHKHSAKFPFMYALNQKGCKQANAILPLYE